MDEAFFIDAITTHLAALKQMEPPAPDTPLLEDRLIDSFDVMTLVAWFEAEHGVALGAEDLTPEHFHSVRTMATMASGAASRMAPGWAARRLGDGS